MKYSNFVVSVATIKGGTNMQRKFYNESYILVVSKIDAGDLAMGVHNV